ncbi:MAG: class I SAM-dependent methyltransferase [Planctomycetia bacterium]|nr:class I SAM-dependent methyltransferase [Planctomycetia bacterium]
MSRRREWFDDERFWRDTYDFMFPPERFEAAPAEVSALLKLAKPRGKAVLDLCSGPGRASVELAKRGYRVTGVDRTRFLMGKARARAKAARVKVEWVESDMRDFARPAAFDLALSLFTSFGYFDDKSEDLLVLRNVFASLRPGGVFVIERTGKERLARIFQPTTSQRVPDGGWLVERHEIFDDWTRIRNEWVVIRGGKSRIFRFHHTLYSGQELRDRLEAAGFADVKLYGSLAGDAYGVNAARLVAVARKERQRSGGTSRARRSGGRTSRLANR